MALNKTVFLLLFEQYFNYYQEYFMNLILLSIIAFSVMPIFGMDKLEDFAHGGCIDKIQFWYFQAASKAVQSNKISEKDAALKDKNNKQVKEYPDTEAISTDKLPIEKRKGL